MHFVFLINIRCSCSSVRGFPAFISDVGDVDILTRVNDYLAVNAIHAKLCVRGCSSDPETRCLGTDELVYKKRL